MTSMILKFPSRSFLLFFLLLLRISNDFQCDCLSRPSSRELENVNLSLLSYETIHKLAIRDQIRNHAPAQKSLETRQTKSLNGLWDFCFDDQEEGFLENWYSFSLKGKCHKQGNFYRMPVPSAFNDLTSNTKAQNYIGWFWYQTSVLPAAAAFDDLFATDWYLQFESVNYLALVWVSPVLEASSTNRTGDSSSSGNNGDEDGAIFLGSHVGGHLPFVLNLNKASSWLAKSGQSARLTVAVSNRLTKDTIPSGRMLNLSEQVGHEYRKFQPDFDFFHFAGIMGNVNLLALQTCHFTNIDTVTTTKTRKQSSTWTSLSFNVCHRGCLGSLALSSAEAAATIGSVELEAQLLSSEGHHIGSRLVVALDSEGSYRASDDDNTSKKSSSISIETTATCTAVEFAIDWEASKHLAWQPANGNQHHFAPILIARFELTTTTATADRGAQLKAKVASLDLFQLRVGLRTTNSLIASSYDSLSQSASNVSATWSGQLLQGFGMHHEQLFSGRTMSLASIMKDIYLLKSIGANLVRTSHYPYSNEYLDACDENGIMVIAECPAVGLNSFSDIKLALHKQILREMMERDHHHPSIIMWSVANEPQSQKLEAEAYFKSLLQFSRQELAQFTVQAGRPLTAAIAQSHRDDRIGGFLDVIMVNRYFGWYEYLGVLEAIRLPLLESLSGWSRKHPEKPLLLSEFGADSVAGLHSSTRLLFSEEYQRDLLVEYERVIDEIYANRYTTGDKAAAAASLSSSNINLIGSMIWNFADFSTHDSLLRVGANRKGIFTRQRQPKLAAQAISDIYLNRTRLRAEETHFSAILCEIIVSSQQTAPAGSSPPSACNQKILY